MTEDEVEGLVQVAGDGLFSGAACIAVLPEQTLSCQSWWLAECSVKQAGHAEHEQM